MVTPSQGVPPPGGYYCEWEGPVRGSDTITTNDNLLRDVRDITQRLNVTSLQDDHTSSII